MAQSWLRKETKVEEPEWAHGHWAKMDGDCNIVTGLAIGSCLFLQSINVFTAPYNGRDDCPICEMECMERRSDGSENETKFSGLWGLKQTTEVSDDFFLYLNMTTNMGTLKLTFLLDSIKPEDSSGVLTLLLKGEGVNHNAYTKTDQAVLMKNSSDNMAEFFANMKF